MSQRPHGDHPASCAISQQPYPALFLSLCSHLCLSSFCSLLWSGLYLRWPHNQQRKRGGAEHVFSYATHDQPSQSAAPVGGHGDQIVATCVLSVFGVFCHLDHCSCYICTEVDTRGNGELRFCERSCEQAIRYSLHIRFRLLPDLVSQTVRKVRLTPEFSICRWHIHHVQQMQFTSYLHRSICPGRQQSYSWLKRSF